MEVFDLLHPKVAELAKKRFGKPTPVQEKAIPPVLEGKNTLIVAPTGFGKTEAAMLPVFSKLVSEKHRPIAVLYITPLKSLNRDLLERILFWSQKLGFGVTVRHGDTTQYQRKLQVEHPDEIFIITPEQLQAMLVGKRIRNLLKNVKYVVIDEVHELISGKRGAQLSAALERLGELTSFQRICLSATIGSIREASAYFSCEHPVKIEGVKKLSLKVEYVLPKKEDVKLSEQLFIPPESAARIRYLFDLGQQGGSMLVFTNTREAAEIISSRLSLLNPEHGVHHSSLSKTVRTETEKLFKAEKIKTLVCTSSLELGIDIGSIDLVVQYSSPRQVVKLLQRVGRSGHSISRKSTGIILAMDGDDLFESAVISRFALEGKLEKTRLCIRPLDVLAHQIVGMILEGERNPENIFRILRRAHPFSSVTRADFESVLTLLQELRILSHRLVPTRKAFDYYFSNISTIPDFKQYKVISVSGEFIGNVDEQFIANLETDSFIVKGRPWKLVSIDSDRVFVEPVEELESAIPAWEGELIPVPRFVAEEVEKLRKKIAEFLPDREKAEEFIVKNYPVGRSCARRMVEVIEKHTRNHPLPETFTLESREDCAVLHSALGSRINETLSVYLSSILSADFGTSVEASSDPYRVIIKNAPVNAVKDALLSGHPVREILEAALPRSSVFSYRFLTVAKRFGVISKKAEYDKIAIKRLIEAYRDTPVFDETMREILEEKFNIRDTQKILSSLSKVRIIHGPTVLGSSFLRADVVKPERAEEEIIQLVKKRILETKLKLVCLNCGKYSSVRKVSDFGERPVCLKCGSIVLGVCKPDEKPEKTVKKYLSGKKLSVEEEKLLNRLKRTADVVVDHGGDGLKCLAGRGIGPETALRILPCKREKLYREIYLAEKKYLETKRFWKA
ncbi:MAG: DEAD/DEAH box helicase [Candidatus Micrarchaeota archaeon]|nr:DEAD/DEAH box helicase [Candidatus Micrarchaeota archaeon]